MKNTIFIVNIEEENKKGRNEPYRLGVSSWKKWAIKNNCEVFVLPVSLDSLFIILYL